MTHRKQRLSLLCSCLLLAACATTEHKETAQPAVLDKSSIAVRGFINEAAGNLLNGRKVSIATTDFTKNSTLALQGNTKDPRGMKGLNGRLLGRPEIHHLSLLTQDGSCYLLAEKTSKRHLLEGVRCRAI